MSLPKCVVDFNTVLKGMIKCIASYPLDANPIAALESLFIDLINACDEDPIAYFVQYIFKNDKYRNSILRDDDFFFVRTGEDEIDDTYIGKLFDFRSIWTLIDDNTKNYMRKCMKAYVKLSIKYIDIITNTNHATKTNHVD